MERSVALINSFRASYEICYARYHQVIMLNRKCSEDIVELQSEVKVDSSHKATDSNPNLSIIYEVTLLTFVSYFEC